MYSNLLQYNNFIIFLSSLLVLKFQLLELIFSIFKLLLQLNLVVACSRDVVDDFGNLFSVLIKLVFIMLLLVLEILFFDDFIIWCDFLGFLLLLVLLELSNIHDILVALRFLHSFNEPLLLNLNFSFNLVDIVTLYILFHLFSNLGIVFFKLLPFFLSNEITCNCVDTLVQEQGLPVENAVVCANDNLCHLWFVWVHSDDILAELVDSETDVDASFLNKEEFIDLL